MTVRVRAIRLAALALTVALVVATVSSVVAGVAPVVAAGPAAPTVAAVPSVAPVKVLGAWPGRCLRAATNPSGAGRIAAVLDGKVTIGSPSDGSSVTLPVVLSADEAQVGWSPSGRYLATGDGRLWTRDGYASGRLFDELTGFWGWSTAADCALGVTGGEPGFNPNRVLSVGRPGAHPTPFLRGDISDFAFTPDGRYVVLVVAIGTTPPVTAGFWRVDLRTGTVVELARLAPENCCVHMAGFTADGTGLWFWGAPGGSVMADGWPLMALDVRRPGRLITYGTSSRPTMTLPRADFVTTCGTRTMAVVGLFRVSTTVMDKRLAFVSPGHLPTYLTPSSRVFVSPACSPNGRYVVAAQGKDGGSSTRLRLTLLTSGGRTVGDLTDGGPWADARPEWATPGVVFERVPEAGGSTQLWFAPAGGFAQATHLDVDEASANAWDWSATPPTGRSNT